MHESSKALDAPGPARLGFSAGEEAPCPRTAKGGDIMRRIKRLAKKRINKGTDMGRRGGALQKESQSLPPRPKNLEKRGGSPPQKVYLRRAWAANVWAPNRSEGYGPAGHASHIRALVRQKVGKLLN